MPERLVLAVDIGEKVFSAFGKVHDGMKVDNLGACRRHSRKRLCQQTQVLYVVCFFHVVRFYNFGYWLVSFVVVFPDHVCFVLTVMISIGLRARSMGMKPSLM